MTIIQNIMSGSEPLIGNKLLRLTVEQPNSNRKERCLLRVQQWMIQNIIYLVKLRFHYNSPYTLRDSLTFL